MGFSDLLINSGLDPAQDSPGVVPGHDPMPRNTPADQRQIVTVGEDQLAPQGYRAAPLENFSPGRYTGNTLESEVGALTRERAALVGNRQRHLGQVGNQGNRLSAQVQRDTAMMAALRERQQGRPSNVRGATDAALVRMKVRQQMANRGEEAVRSQALANRLAEVRDQESRRGQLHNMQQQAASMRQGFATGIQDANQRIKASNYAMYGSIAGMAGRLAAGYFANRFDPGPGSGVETGSGYADYQRMDPNNPYGNNFGQDFVTAPPLTLPS